MLMPFFGFGVQGAPQTHLVICWMVSEIGEFPEMSGVAVFCMRRTAA
jgi:hypothetical protein